MLWKAFNKCLLILKVYLASTSGDPNTKILCTLLFCKAVGNTLKEVLSKDFSDILTLSLPKNAMVGGLMDIHLNDRMDILPMKLTTARPIPLHFQEEANQIVIKALAESIIEQVMQPTTWCSPAFFIQKPGGGLHLVTDFTGLNKRVRWPIHPFLAPHSIVSRLDPCSKVFATLDALSGYHQMALSDLASYYTCFILPSSMYHYLHAPMGLTSLSEEFCWRSDVMFAGIPGV